MGHIAFCRDITSVRHVCYKVQVNLQVKVQFYVRVFLAPYNFHTFWARKLKLGIILT